VFVSLWQALEESVEVGVLTSVDEVLKELQKSDGTITQWAKERREMFTRPSLEEQRIVLDIVTRFPDVMKKKNLLMGIPEADPFLIAKASVKGYTVMTMERKKPNAAKIPNICEHYEVSCVNLFEFFARQGWRF
jgi:hypothetical protein